jgi:hypothetical protein
MPVSLVTTVATRCAGDEEGMRLRRAGLLGMAISFARSERGQRMIRDARDKYDTPANRAKAREALSGRGRSRRA